MKKLTLVVCLLVCAVLYNSAYSEAYVEQFTGTSGLPGSWTNWSYGGAGISIQTNKLVDSGSAGDSVGVYNWPLCSQWKDYAVGARVTQSTWNSTTTTWTGVAARMQDGENFYVVRFKSSGDSAMSMQFRISKYVNGTETPLATSSSTSLFAAGEMWYLELQVENSGNSVVLTASIWQDTQDPGSDTPFKTVTATDSTNPFLTGKCGVAAASGGYTSTWDEFSVDHFAQTYFQDFFGVVDNALAEDWDDRSTLTSSTKVLGYQMQDAGDSGRSVAAYAPADSDSSTWENYTVTAKTTISTWNSTTTTYTGVGARIVDGSNYYCLRFKSSGDASAATQWCLSKFIGGTQTILATSSKSSLFSANEKWTLQLKVETSGSSVVLTGKVWENGKNPYVIVPVATLTFTDTTNIISSGAPGLIAASGGYTAYWDDFQVSGYGPETKVGLSRGWFDHSANTSTPGTVPTMNTIVLYYDDVASDLGTYLDNANNNELKALVEIDRDYITAQSVDAPAIRAFVDSYKNHPACYGFYLYDEPNTHGISVALMETAYNAVKDRTSKPVGVTFCYGDLLAQAPEDYRNAYDILMFDRYPLGAGDPEFNNLGTYLDSCIDAQSYAAAYSKYMWYVDQFYDDDTHRMPTANESRNMMYSNINCGTNGEIFYNHYWCTQQEINTIMTPMMREYRGLEEYLFNKPLGSPYVTTTLTGGGACDVYSKIFPHSHNGSYLVVSIRNRLNSQIVKISLNAAITTGLNGYSRELKPNTKGAEFYAPVALSSGQIASQTFTSYQVRCYIVY
ncbi:MAG: hypothetical protein A2Y10_05590 [Planctomycetes bacterium GWF2_41_51]|nr:MAG: hypothetical protein A2Y10_05590 [Planctomycetes bacterium GWF2_41_51]